MTQPEVQARRFSPPQLLCLIGLVISTVAPLLLVGLTPSLLAHHVIVLEALSSGAVSIITGGAMARVGSTSLALVLLAPLCGIVLFDVFYWWAGRLWGDRVTQGMTANRPRAARWVVRVDSWVAQHGIGVLTISYLLPIPNRLIYVCCGAGGMPLVLFLIGDVLGTLLWTGLFATLGWQLGQGAVDVVHAIDHYSLLITIAIVVVFVAISVLRQRRSAAQPG